MAEHYGGKYSPDAADDPWQGRRRSRAGARANALFIAPIPLVFRAFGSDPLGLFFNLAAFGLLMLAAWLTREGLRAQDAYEARAVARRPALPRKLLGAALTGIGLGVAGLSGGDVVAPVIFTILGTALHVLAFGADPLSDKGTPGLDRFDADRIARAVDEAESYLTEMQALVAPLGDRPLQARVEAFAATARRMFRTVESDPRDLTGARRWLGVYLLGARDATDKFVALYTRRRDKTVRDDYIALLDDLETGFATRTEKMLLDDRSDLDIEIEVLRDRLARETLD
ncbi:5-bromo-4-chloroindolyl phosphate hydrolysis family protein [Maribius pontilimi]|uniref:5-bromo-4-chloroindolyl phosphate hydrolysis family protein n=1 Tax=Palleronia pontilimi TaxID=1964209 RepID=A0A934IAZ0_9RHOB|nr:5-bromo-4-chloroindolyl phosphate hydrolysis family protein [Palleronia pontilimi]MBJ3761152.1 5-bromo-4-chloroindolyl phosphate hydrolysis family protein [Palleronia pontilimi]